MSKYQESHIEHVKPRFEVIAMQLAEAKRGLERMERLGCWTKRSQENLASIRRQVGDFQKMMEDACDKTLHGTHENETDIGF